MPTLPDSVAALDHARGRFLAALDALTPDQRVFRPADGGWTADDVAEHLMLVERGLVGGIETQVAAGEARREVGEPSEPSLLAVVTGLQSERRFQVPERAARFIGPTGTHAETVRAEWDDLMRRWQTLAETVPDDLAGAGLLKHPLAGAVTAEGAARFAAAHVDHHRRQLDRLRTAEGFPSA